MAHPQEKKEAVRRKYIFDQQPLELAAVFCNVPIATARNWKSAAKQQGDDWDKLKAAHIMASGGLEETSRAILSGFLVQYQTTIEQINTNTDISALDKVQALSSLADAYNKTVAASKRVLPETNRLAIALETVGALAEFISAKYPNHISDFIEILESFRPTLTEFQSK